MRFGIKDPAIEKIEKVEKFALEKNVGDFCFINRDKVLDAYVGAFPKVYIFNQNGDWVIRPNCYEMIEENLIGLMDTIPEITSTEINRAVFVNEHVSQLASSLEELDKHDYTVFFYWAVWLGDFNAKKIRSARKTVEMLNQKNNRAAIKLIPVNFDFLEESGWTQEEVESGFRSIKSNQ